MNLTAAMSWALRAGEAALAGRIAGAVALGTMHWRPRLELVAMLRRVADDPGVGASPTASLATAGGGYVAMLQGDLDAAERLASAAIETARDGVEHYLATCTLSVAALYRGDHAASLRWSHDLLSDEALAPAHQVDGYATLALIAAYRGDLGEARRQADRATAAAEAAGAPAQRSFARYAAAEVVVRDDPAAAVPLLADVVGDGDRAGAEFVGGLAATAQLSVLTRLGRRSEALDVAAPLLDRWLRLAVWPQLWTTLRILAELLSDHDRGETAAPLLAAGEHAPSAPAVTGDAERYRRLAEVLRDRNGPRAHERITTQAAMLPRAQVVDRARAAVADLRGAAG